MLPKKFLEALWRTALRLSEDRRKSREWLERFVEYLEYRILPDEASILKPITTVQVPGADLFVAVEKFVVGKTIDGVSIAGIGRNFEENFLGKIETDVAQATLRVQRLRMHSFDAPIIKELSDTAETALTNFWELLKPQGSGKKGNLRVSGWANIAYIGDRNGNPWAVGAGWRPRYNGWFFNATSIKDRCAWSPGNRIVSR